MPAQTAPANPATDPAATATPPAAPAIVTPATPPLDPTQFGISASDPGYMAFRNLSEGINKAIHEIRDMHQRQMTANATELAENKAKIEAAEKALSEGLADMEKHHKKVLAIAAANNAAAQNMDAAYLCRQFNRKLGAMPEAMARAFGRPTAFSVEEFHDFQMGVAALNIAGIDPATREAKMIEILGADKFREFQDRYNTIARQLSWSSGTDSAGGYILPEAQANTLSQQLRLTSVMLDEANVIQIGMQKTELVFAGTPSTAEAQWLAEGTEPSLRDTAILAPLTIKVHKIAALWKATYEVIADALIDVEAFQEAFTMDSMAEMIDKGFLSGTGDGNNQPTGILTADKTGSATDAGIEAADVNHFLKLNTGVASDLPANDGTRSDWLISLITQLRMAYRHNTKWYCSRLTAAALAKTINHDNQYVLVPDFTRPGISGYLLGSPIRIAEHMADYNAANAAGIMFGNMKRAYTIADRVDVQHIVNPYKNYATREHFVSKRMGGAPIDGKSLVFGVSAANA